MKRTNRLLKSNKTPCAICDIVNGITCSVVMEKGGDSMLEVAAGLCRLLELMAAAELGCTKCSFSHMKSSMVPMMLASCIMHSQCEDANHTMVGQAQTGIHISEKGQYSAVTVLSAVA